MRPANDHRPRFTARLALLLAAAAGLGNPPPVVAGSPRPDAGEATRAADPYTAARARLLEDIAAAARETRAYTGRDRLAERIMEAIARVPRHRFVPAGLEPLAWRNQPLPIGAGQTISQPFIVALTTDLIEPRPDDVVLEIGTGSGYQAAMLAELVKLVYSIEIVERLGREAAARLRALGYANVEVRIGDGYRGWPERAPFDAIVVTAAPPSIPDPLLRQLKPGGRMVIPVGAEGRDQQLLLLVKRADGGVERRVALPVRFVPMTGQAQAPGR